MYKTGLLLLTTPVQQLVIGNKLQRILNNVKTYVSSTLYVHMTKVNPSCNFKFDVSNDLNNQPQISASVLPFVSKFYKQAALQCNNIDVNIFVHNLGYDQSIEALKHDIPQQFQCILCDIPSIAIEENIDQLQRFVSERYQCNNKRGSLLSPAPLLSICCDDEANGLPNVYNAEEEFLKRDSVVLGGTFDNIHIGHKILLSEALLLARRKMVIGVSSGPLLKRKTLKELILPFEQRKQNLEYFLRSVGNINSSSHKSGVDLHIEEITDPFGPSIVDPDLQTIVVSKETQKGGQLVNERRNTNGLSKLDIHVINKGELLDLETNSKDELSHLQENKISSSVCRYNKLGTLLKPVMNNLNVLAPVKKRPYVIGLTGGIASGKSSVAKRLEALGTSVIDCDKLGHVSYLPGTTGFDNVVKEFGSEVIDNESGIIDRKILGKLVFGNKDNLQKLNLIIWPEIEKLAKKQITSIMNEKANDDDHVIFLDAAVLLEASWDSFCDEVWVVLVPEEEAKTRLMNRNKIDEKAAQERIISQMSNAARLENANVVLSTLWEPAATQKQVEKAWKLLQGRLRQKYHQSSKI